MKFVTVCRKNKEDVRGNWNSIKKSTERNEKASK